MRAVPFEEWVELLARSADADEPCDPDRNPAVKLVDFYRHAARPGRKEEASMARTLDSSQAERASRTLKRVGAVDAAWIAAWMEQWGVVGV